MGVRILNNFGANLSAGINSSTTTIPLAAGSCAIIRTKLGLSAGSELPAGDYFYGTLINDAGVVEVVKIIAIGTSGDNVTAEVRGADGTTAASWLSGDQFRCRPNAAVFADIKAEATNIDGLHFKAAAGNAIAADTTLNATTHTQHWHYVSATCIVTLPTLASTQVGRTTFTLLAAADFTLKGNGSEAIIQSGVGSANTHVIQKGQTVVVTHNGGDWYLTTVAGSLNPAAFTAETVIDGTNDYVYFWDTTASRLRKTTVASLLNVGIANTKQTVAIPAGALKPRANNGCATLATTNGASGQPDIDYLAFDGAAAEYAKFVIPMPKGWDEGTITASFQWRRASGTGAANVVWGIRAVAVSDNDTPVASFGTAATVTDDAKTTTANFSLSGETGACTIGGSPVENDLVFFEVFRDATNGSDTLDSVDAWLTSVRLHYTAASISDA